MRRLITEVCEERFRQLLCNPIARRVCDEVDRHAAVEVHNRMLAAARSQCNLRKLRHGSAWEATTGLRRGLTSKRLVSEPIRLSKGWSSRPRRVIGPFGRLFQVASGTLKLELHNVVGNDQHVV